MSTCTSLLLIWLAFSCPTSSKRSPIWHNKLLDVSNFLFYFMVRAWWRITRSRMNSDPISPVSYPPLPIKPTPTLADPGCICDHWGRWKSYDALRKAASICKPCRVLRDWFRLHFSARLEAETGGLKQLDEEICAQFPSVGGLPGQTASFHLRSLNSFASVLEARSGNNAMECVVIMKTGNKFFGPGMLINWIRYIFVQRRLC